MESKNHNPYELKTIDKKSQNIISHVDKESIAEEMEIEPGDALLTINGKEIVDLIDYMYHMSEEYVEVEIQKSDGEIWVLDIDKEPGEDLGIEFTNPIIDNAKSCNNKCIFCFIDQLPGGMRDTLYFKDDDSRLSFLQGNFVTLTNMKHEDIQRMVDYKLTSVNVSIHTTNPELRIKMLGNKFAGIILERLKMLTDGGIEVNGQIVLCKGYNDGVELARTIDDLTDMENRIQSLAVVPFGATKYRQGLAVVDMFLKEDAANIIDYVEQRQNEFLKKYKTRFVFLSDEFYLLANRKLPEHEEYEGYIQLENGVGLIRKFENEIKDCLLDLPVKKLKRKAIIATGTGAFQFMKNIVAMINSHFKGIPIEVLQIENSFFGNTINVAGLLTGRDVINALKHIEADVVILPETMFRSGEEVFLDDVLLQQVKDETGKDIYVSQVDGDTLLDIISQKLT